MYCYHCGYKIDEEKIEKKQSTYKKFEGVEMDTQIAYVCPRCGHLIHADGTHEDVKSLARACHAELQRGRNDFFDTFFAGYAWLASIWAALLLGVLCFFLYDKKVGFAFLLTEGFAALTAYILKKLIQRPRPFAVYSSVINLDMKLVIRCQVGTLHALLLFVSSCFILLLDLARGRDAF